ncbi:hypothetical protein [Scopulibacillus cellulosilyticus]|uniref:Transcriptional regulator n=1 Tax=Scopulibacillus cellulosilyticus TaxID=2665665 RepID=A0ABW2PZL3_9BACL
MKTSILIINYLQEHPGSSYKRILRYCETCIHPSQIDNGQFKSHVASRLRRLRKKGMAINKGNSWYLNGKKQNFESA